MLGFSGARIEQVECIKKTCKDSELQATWCKILGDQVCPKIYSYNEDSYLMEKLYTPPEFPSVFEIKQILQEKVWNWPYFLDASWRHDFLTWASEKSPDLLPQFNKLYPEDKNSEMGCLIHGDCTLANVMLNESGDIRLIDPLRPMGKIPALREVDMGKLLQSAIGWESVLQWKGNFDLDGINKSCLLEDENVEMIEKSLFWLRVQLTRILPYAVKNGRDDIYLKLQRVIHELRV